MQQLNAPSVRWEWISEAWNLFTKQWSTWVLMILVTCLVMGLIYLPFYFVAIFSMVPSVSDDGVVTPASGFLPIVLFPVMYLAIICVISWLFGGLYSAAFKQLRGEQIAVGDLFSGGRYFSRMIGALVLIGIASGIGGMLCLIPGLIVYGLAFLTVPMIVEGGMGTIDAIKASVEVTKKDWLMFTLFALALGLIASAGGIACGVGVLATYPLLFLGHALAYRDLVGMPGAQSPGQFMPPPPPDYRDYAPSQASAQPQPPAWTPPPNYGSTPTPESATKTCPHCGATLARAVNFCNQCGRPLRGA